MAVVATDFDNRADGFQFTNQFSLDPALFGRPELKEWHLGLCGGMCFAALDRFRKGEKIPNLGHPPGMKCPDAELLWELFSRQALSLYPTTWLKIAKWQLTSDLDDQFMDWSSEGGSISFTDMFRRVARIGARTSRVARGVATLTQEDEFPIARGQIDGGIPMVLCLVRVRGSGADPTDNHQVLATGYEVVPSAHSPDLVRIRLYDPNHPRTDSLLEFRLTGAPIGGTQSFADGSPSRSFRGFFTIDCLPSPLLSPRPLSPAGDTWDGPGSLSFRWHPSESASSHVLEIETPSGRQTFKVPHGTNAKPNFAAAGGGPHCRWRVCGVDAQGYRGYLSPWKDFRLRGFVGGGGAPSG